MASLSRRALLGSIPLAVLAAGCSNGSSNAKPGSLKTSGPGPGHYKMDLGGYTGPELTTESITLRLMRQSWNDPTNAAFEAQLPVAGRGGGHFRRVPGQRRQLVDDDFRP